MAVQIENLQSPSAEADVLIIGAGPVGAFLAYRLGKQGITVTVLEKAPELPYSPRAVGYYGAAQVALQKAGLYDLVRAEGFMTAGLCWRTPPVSRGTDGGKTYGEMIASQPLCDPNDTTFPFPSGLLNLRQSELTKLLLREALHTGFVTVRFNAELTAIEDPNPASGDRVTVVTRNPATNTYSRFSGAYLVGADGGKSTTRKLLGIPCLGHTWPERLISTDVVLLNEVDPVYHTCYVMATPNPTILTPLADPVLGQKTLWRYTISVPAEDTRSDEELLKEETIKTFYDEVMVGPRPLDVTIQQRAVYRIHQRLVQTMRRGRCLLAGDAAHLNNPYGAMGLNTGLLDADALSEALIMILKESASDQLLTLYSDERRKVFQSFVNPTTTENKLRLQQPYSKETVREDYFFRELQDATPETLQEKAKPYFEFWCTDIRALAGKLGV
ncbi:hypothetical protein APSETT444_006887 [Aspergillus pseudonomiae]